MVQRVRHADAGHGALTYPLYARQLSARLEAGEWLAFEVREGFVPIALLVAKSGETKAELLSVAVIPERRRQGLASRLLQALHAYGRERGLEELGVVFRHDIANLEMVKSLLVRNGWSEPEAITEIGSLSAEKARAVVLHAARFRVGFGAQVVAWAETTPAQRTDLEAASQNWYPSNLAPSRFPLPGGETISSALLSEGRIIGWMLVAVLPGEPPPVDFCCAFVHPAWQRRGAIMWLLARSAQVLLATHDDFTASWTVAEKRPQTRRFFRRRLQPFGARFGLMLTSHAPGFPVGM